MMTRVLTHGTAGAHTASQGDQSQNERFAYADNGKLNQALNAASTLQWFHDEVGNPPRITGTWKQYRGSGKITEILLGRT